MSLPSDRRHRSSASKPNKRPVARSTAGWNTSDGLPSSSITGYGMVDSDVESDSGIGGATGAGVGSAGSVTAAASLRADFHDRLTHWLSAEVAAVLSRNRPTPGGWTTAGNAQNY